MDKLVELNKVREKKRKKSKYENLADLHKDILEKSPFMAELKKYDYKNKQSIYNNIRKDD